MASAAPAPSTRPRVERDVARGVVGGVCAALGPRLGMDPRVLRALFVLATLAGGLGVAAYAVAWALLPARAGSRAAGSRRARLQVASGVALLAIALLLSLRELGLWFSDALVWPVVLAAAGAALVWRQARSHVEQDVAAAPPAPARAAPRSSSDVAGIYSGGFGVALVIGAGLLFLFYNGALGALRDVVLALVVIAAGGGLILAPFLWRIGRNLAAERAARIRSQERAEVAAHLHDSVLQTLALVQKRADDPRAVATIARRQERELRAWLFDGPDAADADASVAAALRVAAAEVEEAHGVPVEVVTVGDAPLDEPASALVAAAREALTNAAKFAGDAGPVALFAEVDEERVQAFVRDRGAGFDLAAVPADRRGVRESILARMTRHGGRATIGPAPGGGTEVELSIDRGAA